MYTDMLHDDAYATYKNYTYTRVTHVLKMKMKNRDTRHKNKQQCTKQLCAVVAFMTTISRNVRLRKLLRSVWKQAE